MTVANEDGRTGPYNGNGSTTVFAYDFKALDEAHIVVTLTSSAGVEATKTLTTHYSVSGVGTDGGGNITMVTAPASGELLTITRDVPKTQLVDLQNRGGVAPTTLETMSDRLTQITQDIDEVLARTPKFPVSSTETDVELPATLTANAALVVNATGDGFSNGPTTTQISAAEGYATAAAASETAAAASETAAAASETAAGASETAAGLSETAAAASETNASASETAAGLSETAAAASETAAGLSETAAAASETAAGLSETAAGTSETNAATSASNAATSETNAATSASNAATSETNAAASEAAAAASAAGFTITSISDQANSSTGWLDLPSGNDAQRGSPTSGAVRYNTDDSAFEGYDGSAWGALGGGNTSSAGLWENAATISADYTISVGNNALSAGPITVGSGVTVTVPSGSTWTVI
jgi:hypothetical protein